MSNRPSWTDDQTAVRWRSSLPAAALFFTTFIIFTAAPMSQVADSHYSMLLSHNLIHFHSFALDRYFRPPLDVPRYPGYEPNLGRPLHIEQANGHLYYVFPPGSSMLSIPFVIAAEALGVSPVTRAGGYNVRGEIAIQRGIAAVLMASTVVVFFLLSSQVLPVSLSVSLALAVALSTPILSTASRGLWSHTWGTTLMAIAALLLFRDARGGQRAPALVLATLMAWAFVVRPSNAAMIVAVSVYVVLVRPRLAIQYLCVGGAWLALFLAYSWGHFGTLLPSYVTANSAQSGYVGQRFVAALAGVLFSPSRGFVVYVPAILAIVYLLIAHRRFVTGWALVSLSAACVALTAVVSASSFAWCAGHCYGARYATDTLPWIVVLAALGLEAAMRTGSAALRRALVVGALVTVVGMAINVPGAWSVSTQQWNVRPEDIVYDPGRLWDWRQPQFLAWASPVPTDRVAAPSFARPEGPLLARLDLRTMEPRRGFDPNSYSGYRWTIGHEAELAVHLTETNPTVIVIHALAYYFPCVTGRQRATVKVDGRQMAALEVKGPFLRPYVVPVPGHVWHGANVVTLDLPDAISPASFGIWQDPRVLGIGVQSVEVYRKL